MKNSICLNHYHIVVLIFLYSVLGIAQNEENHINELSISSSNDAFLILGDDLDRFYSFGFGASLKLPNRRILGLEKLFSNKVGFYSEVGLRIEGYTPTDKDVTDFEIDTNTISFDRPFAGVSYGVFNINYTFQRSNFKSGIIIGLLGESSQAGDIQTWFHENITNDEVFKEEWVYQVPNQLIYNINMGYTYDFLPENNFFDLFAVAQAQLGNLKINATPTLGMRLGKFEKISESISFDNSVLGDNNSFELIFQSTISFTANIFDATAQGNIFNRNFEFEVENFNRYHSVINHSIYIVYNMFSLGYEQYFTKGVTLKNAQHSFSKILLKYRF